MSKPSERLCDASGLGALIATMARAIADGTPDSSQLRLVGVRRRGHPIASRLAAELRPMVGYEVPVGAVDITLYRDDLDHGSRWPVLLGTDIPFSVDGADVVLVDDVLYTGRTVRAALNAVCDLGRPARVRLAALIDRGHRELPIQPDVVGLAVETRRDQRGYVRVTPTDPVDEVIRGDGW
jgi:pyrimidine operon attenuation protein/uracil phosphoribosyltransferase